MRILPPSGPSDQSRPVRAEVTESLWKADVYDFQELLTHAAEPTDEQRPVDNPFANRCCNSGPAEAVVGAHGTVPDKARWKA